MSSPANKPPQTASPKPQRTPAPTLFVLPSSRNASNTSLLPPPTKDNTSRNPLSRQHSLLGEVPRTSRTSALAKDRTDAQTTTEPSLSPDRHTPGSAQTQTQAQDSAPFSPLSRDRDRGKGPQSQSPEKNAQELTNEREEALWAEMQSTLAEVELSASASGAGMNAVFGAGHSKTLEGLRLAQAGLAQAWARSEGEGEADGLAVEREEGRGRSGTVGSGKSLLEEETEMDVALARKRREANDKYFQRVNKGVLDVVAKLEEVAKAMKGVEMESREIWGDRDSVEGDV